MDDASGDDSFGLQPFGKGAALCRIGLVPYKRTRFDHCPVVTGWASPPGFAIFASRGRCNFHSLVCSVPLWPVPGDNNLHLLGMVRRSSFFTRKKVLVRRKVAGLFCLFLRDSSGLSGPLYYVI